MASSLKRSAFVKKLTFTQPHTTHTIADSTHQVVLSLCLTTD